MSNKQISLFGEDISTSYPPDSLANRSAMPEEEKARKMTAISGRTLLEQLEKFNRATSWEKTLLGSLIGMTEWYSSRSALTWKLKAIKSHRLYYQLVVKTHRIKEIGHGSSPKNKENKTNTMIPTPVSADSQGTQIRKDGTAGSLCGKNSLGHLPTPTASDAEVGAIIGKKDKFKVNNNGTLRRHIQTGQNMSVNLARQAIIGYLPTPTQGDGERGGILVKGKTKIRKSGTKWASDLTDLAKSDLLPTPTTSGDENYETRQKRQGHNKAMSYLEANIDYKVNYLPTINAQEGNKITGKENQDSMTKLIRKSTNATNQLNHHFVAEMMGYPAEYTDVAFLDKESDRLKKKMQDIASFDHQHWKDFPVNHPVIQDHQRESHSSDKISFAKLRRESIKAYGNAIVPEVAKRIFEAIQYDHERSN